MFVQLHHMKNVDFFYNGRGNYDEGADVAMIEDTSEGEEGDMGNWC